MSPDELAKALAQPGRVTIPYLDRYNPERSLALECFRPKTQTPDKPVVIVQHGASRNGAEYCEAWVPTAERHGLLIVAITFPKEAWPDAVPEIGLQGRQHDRDRTHTDPAYGAGQDPGEETQPGIAAVDLADSPPPRQTHHPHCFDGSRLGSRRSPLDARTIALR